MQSVKGWAENAGIKLENYDGFTKAYQVVSGRERTAFSEYNTLRHRDAGFLFCTRKAFLSGLNRCTMHIPQLEELDKIAETLPEYAESNIGMNIAFISGQIEHGMTKKEEYKDKALELLELIKKQSVYRSKSIELNGNSETKIENIEYDKDNVGHFVDVYQEKSIEKIEERLSKDIQNQLESISQLDNIEENLFIEILKQIDVLQQLKFSAARNEGEFDLESEDDIKAHIDEFGYIPFLEIAGQGIVKQYKVIGSEGIENGVLYSNKGVTTAARVARKPYVNEYKEQQEKSLNARGNDESTDEKDTEITQALQTIDKEVKPEERKRLSTRIKQWITSIFKGKEKNERE